jgi:hypothetical protein
MIPRKFPPALSLSPLSPPSHRSPLSQQVYHSMDENLLRPAFSFPLWRLRQQRWPMPNPAAASSLALESDFVSSTDNPLVPATVLPPLALLSLTVLPVLANYPQLISRLLVHAEPLPCQPREIPGASASPSNPSMKRLPSSYIVSFTVSLSLAVLLSQPWAKHDRHPCHGDLIPTLQRVHYSSRPPTSVARQRAQLPIPATPSTIRALPPPVPGSPVRWFLTSVILVVASSAHRLPRRSRLCFLIFVTTSSFLGYHCPIPLLSSLPTFHTSHFDHVFMSRLCRHTILSYLCLWACSF